MYDVLIVGARCAGSPTAMLLARKGYRVLLVDKATFPSDAVCTHFIRPPGVSRLQRWGLLERLPQGSCPVVENCSIDFGQVRLAGSPCCDGTPAKSYSVRRRILDWTLIQAAVEAGAEFRPAFTVRELILENGVVTGIRGATRDGTEVTERGRITVGADGSHSAVSRLLRTGEYNVVEPLTCNYFGYWSGVPVSGAEWYVRPGRFCSAAPSGDGLTVISVLKRRAEFRNFRSNIEAGFLEALDLAPDLAERVRAGRREGPFAGTADTTNYFRRPYGPGWALIGDAGYHRDAITAQGISDAFRDADLIAVAIDRGLSGAQSMEHALAEYHWQRDASAAPMFRLTCELARLEPPTPQRMALFEALRPNQADTDRFLGTLAGTVPIPEFYSQANVRQFLQRGEPFERPR